MRLFLIEGDQGFVILIGIVRPIGLLRPSFDLTEASGAVCLVPVFDKATILRIEVGFHLWGKALPTIRI